MIARHGIALAMILPSFVGYESPAVARGGPPSNDPPWNSEHISSLPEEIRKALGAVRNVVGIGVAQAPRI